jgi:beta-lactamase superfamily II metal-dependent hydrolase
MTSENAKNIGGLIDIVSRYKVNEIIKPKIIGTSTALSILDKIIKEKNIKTREVQKGDSIYIDNISFSILFPDPDFKFNKTSKSEMILDISYASSSILLLGDVSKTIQKTLIDYIDKVSIVEYSNSAGDSLVSMDLLNKIKPKYIIISKQIKTNSGKIPKILNNNSYSVLNIKEKGNIKFTEKDMK